MFQSSGYIDAFNTTEGGFDGSDLASYVDNITIDMTSGGLMEVKDNGITTSKIADNSISNSKLLDNSVTTSKISDANITTSKITNNNVTLAKLQRMNNGQLFIGKTGNDLVIGNITSIDGTIIITNGAGTIDISASPEVIATPSFTNITTTNPTSGGGSDHYIIKNGTNKRWTWDLTGTETGSNVGSDLYLNSYSDTGSFLNTLMYYVRKTNIVNIGSALGIGGIGSNNLVFGTVAGGNQFIFNPAIGNQTLNFPIGSVASDTCCYLDSTQNMSNKVFTTPIIARKDSSSSLANHLVIEGATNNNQQLLIGYNTTSDYGSIQAQIFGVGLKPLLLNPSGGIVSIANSNFYTSPVSTTGNSKQIIYGSGTSAGNYPILHIRENTNTNPSEMVFGYRTDNNTGNIDVITNGVAFRDLNLCPGGGTVITQNLKSVNGITVPDGNSGFSLFNELENDTTDAWTTTVGSCFTSTNLTVHYNKVGRKATIEWLDLIGTATITATIAFPTASVPPRMRPARFQRFTLTGLNNGVDVGSCNVIFQTNGSVVFYNSGFTNFTNATSCGIYSGSVTYITAT